MLKNITFICLTISTVLVSCAEKEKTHEEKIHDVVDSYLSVNLKGESIQSYQIDSIQINDISSQLKMKLEVKHLTEDLQAIIDEAKELKKEYQDAKELGAMYSDLTGGNQDVFSNSSNSTIQDLKKKFEAKKKEADELLVIVEQKEAEAKVADNTNVEYFEVIAFVSVTSSTNVMKQAQSPFYISKEYKILKEPSELLNK